MNEERYMELVNSFKLHSKGWKFTAIFPNTQDMPNNIVQKYTFGGIVEQYGFKTSDGSWELIQLPGDTPSYRVKVRRFRERIWRWYTLDLDDVICEGWD